MLPIIPWGGSVLGMIISLKNNARPRRRPFKEKREKNRLVYKSHHPLKFKKVSDAKLQEVNSKILRTIDREDSRRLLIIVLIILAIGSGAIYGIIKYNKTVQEHNARVTVSRREFNRAQAIEEHLDVDERFKYLFADGQKWLEKERYNYAKQQFYDACLLKPDDYGARLGLATAYVNACIKFNAECFVAERILKSTTEKFGRKNELVKLEKVLHSEK